eukprot:SAG31_NODE_444_length_15625_cov_6.047469_13_plen_31_part_00
MTLHEERAGTRMYDRESSELAYEPENENKE